MKTVPPWCGVAIALLTVVTFWWFPGHTVLQSDTQIYIPILQHLENPAVLANDAMAVRPHLGFTIFDEVALGVRSLTHAGFESILLVQQFVYRALGIFGLFLIARSTGLSAMLSLTVAALLSLGATVNGPQVLTVEYEPVPRGFSFGLILLSLGLAGIDKARSAAAACALAFAYHPPTALVLFVLLGAVFVKQRRWQAAAILLVGVALIMTSVLLQPPATEHVPLLGTIDPGLEAIQRMRTSYDWVSMWFGRYAIHYTILFVLALAAWWRLRADLPAPLKVLFILLPVIGALSIPVSWLAVDHWKLLLGSEYQPARYVLYLPFFAGLSCALAGLLAAIQSRFVEAFVFLLVPLVLPLESNLVELSLAHAVLCGGLAVAIVFGRFPALRLAAASLAFVVYPTIGDVVNFPAVQTAELSALASWARESTPADSVFQFADVRRGAEPGVFRVRAERAIYADWKAGGQVNYMPEFARIWADRWKRVERVQPVAVYRDLKIDYVVFSAGKSPNGVRPVWSNNRYVVVRPNTSIE